MNKTWTVLKTEFINTVTRRSFLLTLILVPLVPALILGALSLFGGDQPSDAPSLIPSQPVVEDQVIEGYLDLANIITSTPAWLSEDRLIAYKQEAEARQAVLTGEISGYFVIQSDYLESGSIRYISQDFNPMTSIDTSWAINALIQYNLLGADQARLEAYQNPILVQYVDLAPDDVEAGIDISTSPVAFYVPYGMTMLFYVLIVTAASLMMNSVAKEKENRIMEVLMSSIKPRQLLTGKIFGLGLVGLLQLVVWLGSALVLLRLGGRTLQIPAEIQPSPAILLWGMVFFVLGYLVYATIMAGVGALVGTVKEASQATFIVILPILIPLMMVGAIINQPNAPLPVILSLIPFTAPNTIMTRMAITPIPIWQLALSISLLILTIVLLLRAVAGMFKAQLLLTGKKFSLGLLIRALLGKQLAETESTGRS
ncbi:MAG: ABC transporter permease [Brevefilum sp.]|nr:ABC transporter permease [Brevefilum sp.]